MNLFHTVRAESEGNAVCAEFCLLCIGPVIFVMYALEINILTVTVVTTLGFLPALHLRVKL